MSDEQLTTAERLLLLQIAREAIEYAVNRQDLPELELSAMPPRLQEQGASFVTLTLENNLRGCIGALQASQPLALDVQEHAVAAALEDYRFGPVEPDEVTRLEIEISRLSPSQDLEYSNSNELLSRLQPGVDGVVLRHGFQRATFLPQVWEKVPDPEDFLTQLCYKMDAPGDLWKREHLQVSIYHVEEFREEKAK
jgi:AmmeMemoRadiSam system protein A